MEQGAWVQGGDVVFRSGPGTEIERILPVEKIPLKGQHNVENVLAAVCAARLAGAPASAIAQAIDKFKAVEHRLEFVSTINGVEYLQRLEGHQRGRNGEGDCSVSGRGAPDSRRQGQGCALCAACAAAARTGARGLHHRRCGRQNRIGAARDGADRIVRNAGPCGERRGGCGAHPARWCCLRLRARATTSLRITRSGAASSSSS